VPDRRLATALVVRAAPDPDCAESWKQDLAPQAGGFRYSSVAIAIGECPSAASTTRRESLGASRPVTRLSGSAAGGEQADDEDEDDELEGDACGVLEAALQAGVGD
jgi:hypothetical protein